MFIVIKNDTISLKDISRISRQSEVIKIYFISNNEAAIYEFEDENHATEVEFKVFNAFKEHGLMV